MIALSILGMIVKVIVLLEEAFYMLFTCVLDIRMLSLLTSMSGPLALAFVWPASFVIPSQMMIAT